MNYCIGDIHGCYDEMLALLRKIEQQDAAARFVFVGDFVDRGPKVWETLEWMMTHITADGKYQSVQGNHEQMVVQWYLQYCEWHKNRIKRRFTTPPRPNYDFMQQAEKQGKLDPESLKPIMDFFVSLPFHKVLTVPGRDGEDVTYDVAHAWYDYDEPEDSAQQYMDNLWRREVDGNALSSHIIVHGHTPTLSEWYLNKPHTAPGMIVYRKNDINIDGGCCFSPMFEQYGLKGFLCGLCLETLEEYYAPEPIEAFGADRLAAYDKQFRAETDPYREEIKARLAPCGESPRGAVEAER